jgi:intein/homing endonuclease
MKWTETEIKELKKDYLAFVKKEIMIIKYKREWSAIQAKANFLKIYRGTQKRVCTYKKYAINENFFSFIDSFEKAYILGFLFADGSNDISRNRVRLTLNKIDLEILKKIKKLIQPKKPLYKNKDCYEFCISSSKISKDLYALGCVNNKTHILKFPLINESLISHFIRGYFDGDGCVSIGRRKDNNNSYHRINIAGTLDMLINIQKILVKELNFNFTKIQKNKNTFILEYSGRLNCKKFEKYIYKDATLFLTRKFNIFQKKLC